MINTLLSTFKILTTQSVNRFIYFFKRIPLLGKILSDKIYFDTSLKLVLASFVFVLKSLAQFIYKAIYIFLMIVLPILLVSYEFGKHLSNTQMLNAGIHIFVCLSFIIGALQNPKSLNNDRDKFICIKLMGMRSDRYIISNILFQNIILFIAFLPSILISTIIVGLPFYKGIMLAIMFICARFLGEAIHLAIFARTEKIINKKWWFYLGLYSFLALAYVPVLYGYTFDYANAFLSLIVFIISIIIGGLSLLYIVKYKYFQKASNASLKREELNVNTKQVQAQAKFAGVKMKDSDFAGENFKSAKINKKKGYELLNAIFFERHRRLLIKPVFIRLGIILVGFIGFVAFSLFFPDKTGGVATGLMSSLNAFVFIMYCMSTGDKIAKALFFNCDISLLRYGFYREKSVILKNFWIRLKKSIWLNLVPALAMCGAIVGIVLISQESSKLYEMVPFLASILCLSVFFSVHHMFLYYVFQPYTTELDVKNPFFKIINAIVYILSYICLQIDSAPSFFVGIVLGATIVYIITAIILVLKFAPKTFKVK